MSLLNQIPVLDKGSVSLLNSSLTYEQFKTLHAEIFRKAHKDSPDTRLLDACSVHIKAVCPLFVQMTFPEHNLTYITYRTQEKPQAYIPTVSEVNAQDLEASEAIQKDIEQTTAALLLNPQAYQMERCDLFVSQVISPVSVYNTIIITGNLSQWLRYLSQVGLPSPIEAYRRAIEDAISGEYPFIKEMLKRKKHGNHI